MDKNSAPEYKAFLEKMNTPKPRPETALLEKKAGNKN
jgi:hypothetical protein